ncbi:2-phosphosulfolactate phosphatase [Pleomorphovibrio marinus]|uniref:2-phosphosulfolactate phosphatase n=1 Tax=Pleomorphovibrio marinus TaxID=2164132 RepID=UPI000E0CA6BE|nr:2-phosphosulfolactate phosphatase [Pleomorphovibrio marinus]
MNQVEICFSPELIHLHELKGKIAVVVDIFRATSTMVTAAANGVLAIKPMDNLESCKKMKSEGFITAGERDGKKAPGFDLGNSPLSYLNGKYQGEKVAITTTNGTVAIAKSKEDAEIVIIGAFLNLDATVAFLQEKRKDVVIVCAGWKGKYNLEDSLYAGALVEKLGFAFDCDGALAMSMLFQKVKGDLPGFLKKASHAKRLQNHNIEADIDFCLTFNRFNLVLQLQEELLVTK